jgi:hypothetical protein
MSMHSFLNEPNEYYPDCFINFIWLTMKLCPQKPVKYPFPTTKSVSKAMVDKYLCTFPKHFYNCDNTSCVLYF